MFVKKVVEVINGSILTPRDNENNKQNRPGKSSCIL
jgi:hypothetical protein